MACILAYVVRICRYIYIYIGSPLQVFRPLSMLKRFIRLPVLIRFSVCSRVACDSFNYLSVRRIFCLTVSLSCSFLKLFNRRGRAYAKKNEREENKLVKCYLLQFLFFLFFVSYPADYIYTHTDRWLMLVYHEGVVYFSSIAKITAQYLSTLRVVNVYVICVRRWDTLFVYQHLFGFLILLEK